MRHDADMSTYVGGILQLVIWGGWLVTMLWGSIMAFRGARNWSTLLQVIGTGGMLAGALSVGVGTIFMISTISSSTGPGSSTSSVLSSGLGFGIVMAVGGILVLLGLILFTAGYVGMCAKYGSTERRATELEGLVMQLQQRLPAGL